MMRFVLVAAIAATSAVVMAQDPAPGWTAYLTAQCPSGTHLTHFEAKWKNLENPSQGGGFYSPWIGSDTSDNLDLIQPVNPWLGDSWAGYTEHFNWNGMRNHNSAQFPTNAGDIMHGVMSYLGDSANAYKVTQTDMTTGGTSSLYADVPSGKQFTVLYVVFEKVMQSCAMYPPNEVVEFFDMKVFCSGRQVFPDWTAAVKDPACDMTGHVVNKTSVKITWNTNAAPPTSDILARAAKGSKKNFVKLTKDLKN